ncbi:UNVERIFIED_CONTAM: putative expansin-B2 [Sesamum calycinum]|uniref:Expansin-B2 n=1 Tax=Sesamum calycinum TaxID=2727403 RepID=A0AAW2JD76_9LAMI
MNIEAVDVLVNNNTFYSAVATWYGDPEGSGSGGACGLEDDVANPPYYGMISAGNNNLFKSGKVVGVVISGKAFGYLAKRGEGDALRNKGRINIEYQRVQCYYNNMSIAIKIDRGSNQYYLAFALENVNGDGEIGSMELIPSNSGQPLYMQQVFGATWKADIPIGTSGPYSVRITSLDSRRTITAYNSIPADWHPGQYYIANVNF